MQAALKKQPAQFHVSRVGIESGDNMSVYIYNSKQFKIIQGLSADLPAALDDYVNETYGSRKKASEIIEGAYFRLEKSKTLSSVKSKRIHDCWQYIKVAKHKITHKVKLISANSCKVRLCPACAWRRMHKYAHENAKMLSNFAVYSNYQYILLTVTIKNVKGDELSAAITDMLQAWKRMVKIRRIKPLIIGSIRNLEVTYNRKENSYHPHIHAVIAVPPSYFGKDYINQREWRYYWREAMRINYDPRVDIRKIKDILNDKTVFEISKYVAKISSFLDLPPVTLDKVVMHLDNALNARRIISYSGVFRQWRREQKLLDDIEDESPVELGDEWEVYAYEWIYKAKKYIQIENN